MQEHTRAGDSGGDPKRRPTLESSILDPLAWGLGGADGYPRPAPLRQLRPTWVLTSGLTYVGRYLSSRSLGCSSSVKWV